MEKETLTMEEHIHQGRNVKRFREMQGIKQEAFASLLGHGWTQRKVSTLENTETIDGETLSLVAVALHVSPEAIQNFSEETGFHIFSNKYEGNSASIQYNFNPVDKWVEALEENKKLYERLLEAEKKQVETLLKANEQLQALLEKMKEE